MMGRPHSSSSSKVQKTEDEDEEEDEDDPIPVTLSPCIPLAPESISETRCRGLMTGCALGAEVRIHKSCHSHPTEENFLTADDADWRRYRKEENHLRAVASPSLHLRSSELSAVKNSRAGKALPKAAECTTKPVG